MSTRHRRGVPASAIIAVDAWLKLAASLPPVPNFAWSTVRTID